jgi:flagellar biosynthesis/type III secretory pathway protein FliH
MKPVPIANYLDHIGHVGEKTSPRRETSPFRPRSLQNQQLAEFRQPPKLDREPASPAKAQGEHHPRRLAWDRQAAPAETSPRDSLVAREMAKAQEMALRLAEAHARGREEGLAEGHAEASELYSAERAAERDQALVERLEFQLNEYAQLEGSIRAGFREVEHTVAAAVSRILGPFLVRQVIDYVIDELCKNIERLVSGGGPGLITVRGPKQVLSLLRDRVAGLPAEFDFVDSHGPEAVVEANATQIATELQPWADLLASLDPEPNS